MKTNSIFRIAVGTGLILLVPLVAMLFSDDVDWGVLDFAVIGSLLLGAGLIYELIASKVNNRRYKQAVALIIIAAVFLIWAELSVGIFGSPFAGS
ncbi:MAG: hypothetical protein M3Q81_03580 [bacterium]|nr:hypothetical protein [bacterium]